MAFLQFFCLNFFILFYEKCELSQWGCFSVRMHVYACLCVDVCVCVCMSVYMYLCLNVCIYVCMYLCMYACLFTCMCVCMYAYMYVCMYICLYVCLHVYVHVCMIYVCACMYWQSLESCACKIPACVCTCI